MRVRICGCLHPRGGSCWDRMQFFLCGGVTGAGKPWKHQLKAEIPSWLCQETTAACAKNY